MNEPQNLFFLKFLQYGGTGSLTPSPPTAGSFAQDDDLYDSSVGYTVVPHIHTAIEQGGGPGYRLGEYSPVFLLRLFSISL